jgi:RNA polymerase sigma factor (sigma-70 family)
VTCPWCEGPLPAPRPGRGRKPVYCAPRCSKAARHARRDPEVLRAEWARANARRAGRRASSRAPRPRRVEAPRARPWRPAPAPAPVLPPRVARVLEAARRAAPRGDPWDLASEVWLRTRGLGPAVRLRGAALDAIRADAAQRGVDDRRRAKGTAVRWAGAGAVERAGRRDRGLEAVELRDALDLALGRLGARERVLLRVTVVDGMTLAEAGAVLGVSESRACQVRLEALRKLGAG